MKKKKIYDLIYKLLLFVWIILIIILLYNVFPFVRSYIDTKHDQSTYIITETKKTEESELGSDTQSDESVQFNIDKYPFLSNFSPVIIDHEALKEKNSDYIGWIDIPGTIISYPVFYSKDNENYMHHDALTNTYKYAGSIFADMNTDDSARNVNIYGHNMKVGTMFSTLNKYGNRSYFEEHPYFVFYPCDSDSFEIYQIFSCFVIPGDDPDGIIKKFHFSTDAELNDFIRSNKALGIYDTGVNPSSPEKVMTLCTCHGKHENDQRFVVEGSIISDAER